MDAKVISKATPAAEPPPTIRLVGIVGSGQMGNGIAHVVALAGYDVLLNDLKKEAVDNALAVIKRNMVRQISRGLITEGDMNTALRR
ncbi:MAG: 3-hydroxyacyl-CoA dehydrogenase NAD-binding domain-containing protein, partial [Hyphomicrobiaceae bacterium]